jgi:hypothetical protein
MTVILVAGPLANKPGNAGGAWERFSWVRGLERLGCDVYFVEQIAPEACVDGQGKRTPFLDSANVSWFRSVTAWFGFGERSILLHDGGRQSVGISWTRFLEIAGSADLLVNLSGHLTLEPVLERIGCKAYVDVDPGFTQCWHADADTPFTIPRHDFYFTIGERIGAADCPIPASDIRWQPTRQPVVLEDWPACLGGKCERFTTVASWRSYGPVRYQGRTYGLKLHEFRKFLNLPRRTWKSLEFEIALDIHAGDDRDLASLRDNGWRIVAPASVANDPAAFRRYVQESAAEFSVAQGVYVETQSGWFSDRSVRYLASGKPALVQDTGFSRIFPTGEGVVPFRTLEEAASGAERIMRDYDRHCRAARAFAEEYFDSDKVLTRLLDEIGVAASPASQA